MVAINRDVVFIRGFQRGAIYDFMNRKVYSINRIACEIIEKYCKNISLKQAEKDYLAKLEAKGLLQKNWTPTKFIVPQFLPKLKTVWLEITNKCNLHCVHCYEGDTHSPLESPLTLDQWKSLIDQICKVGAERIIVIGGEPCCCQYAEEILTYLTNQKSENVQVTFFTNATLLSDDLINLISRSKISVKISLYGSTAEIHDKITRVPGSFDKTIASIYKLVKKGVPVNSAVIAMKENQADITNMKEFVESIGVTYSGYDVIRNVFGGSQSEHTPDNKTVLEHSFFSQPSFYADKTTFYRNATVNSCWFGKFAIAENGDVFPCEFERTLKYGNVKNDSIENLLSSRTVKENWFLSFENIKECQVCEYRFACKDCRPLGISVRGSLTDKNPRCGYDPYTGTWSTKTK